MTAPTLYFLIQYNWINKETKFIRYDTPDAETFQELPHQTIHRCSVQLSPITKTDEETKELIEATEHYNESDKLDPGLITVENALHRANCHRMFPVLPNDGVSIGWRIGQRSPYKVSDTVTIRRPGKDRKFRVTVEEIED